MKMKKGNLKGKLNLGKDTISKLELGNLNGGAVTLSKFEQLCLPTGLCTAVAYCTGAMSRCEWLTC
jgi:hypothetical protein